jgi:hypothetical protein
MLNTWHCVIARCANTGNRVTAHFSDHPTRPKPVTTILIKLAPQVLARQQQLEAMRRG